MKTLHFFCRRFFLIFMGIILVACSHESNLFEEDLSFNETNTKDAAFVYTMHLDCDVPSFEGISDTRSSASWEDGSTVYIYFNGVYGTAVYKKSTNEWTVTTGKSLSVVTTAKQCNSIYTENLESETSTTIYTTALSPFYYGTGTYTYTSSTGIDATIKMVPDTWRLRFKGAVGSMITVSSSDVSVYTSFQKSNFAKVETGILNVTLTVDNDGYTPYIHGIFLGTTTDFALTVSTTEGTFTRTVDGSSLNSAGASAYMNIPTEASHNNWEMVQIAQDCAVKPNYYVPMTDVIVTDFTVGDNVSQFIYTVLPESDYNQFSDENQLVDYITNNEGEPYGIEYKDYEFAYKNLTPNTKYYLVSFGYNSAGVRGEITATPFTTRSESLPIAKITDIKTLSDGWTVFVSLNNNAKSYYCWGGSGYYDYTDYFFAYEIYWYIANYSDLTKFTSTSFGFSFNDEGCLAVITIAMDASGNLGNPSIARATNSSSAAQRTNSISSVSNRTSKPKKLVDFNLRNVTIH